MSVPCPRGFFFVVSMVTYYENVVFMLRCARFGHGGFYRIIHGAVGNYFPAAKNFH